MDCKSAWDDVIAEWKREYRSRGDVQFSPLVMDKYGQTISGECGSEQWTSWSACPATASCSDHSGGILPAGAEVANALGRIHGVFQSYYRTIPGITVDTLKAYQTFTQDLKVPTRPHPLPRRQHVDPRRRRPRRHRLQLQRFPPLPPLLHPPPPLRPPRLLHHSRPVPHLRHQHHRPHPRRPLQLQSRLGGHRLRFNSAPLQRLRPLHR